MRTLGVFGSMMLVFLFMIHDSLGAMDTGTLPTGIFIIDTGVGYKTSNRRFTNQFGFKTEDLGDDYRVEVWDSDLGITASGFPGGVAVYGTEPRSLGKIDADFDSYGLEIPLTFAYGITDDVAIMVMMSFKYINQVIDPQLHPPTEPNKGFRAFYVTDPDTGNKQLSLIMPENNPANYLQKDDLLFMIQASRDDVVLDALKDLAFDYEPIADFKRWGIGDMRLAFRYRFFGNDESLFAQALSLMFVFPTGRMDDPNNLLDSAHGDGQMDLGFFYGVDVRPVQGLMFNLTFGYTDAMFHKSEWRTPISISRNEDGAINGKVQVGTKYNNLVEAKRDIGGNFDIFVTVGYDILEWLGVGAEVYFYYKFQDDYELLGWPQSVTDMQDEFKTLKASGASQDVIDAAQITLWQKQDAITNLVDGMEYDTILSCADLNLSITFNGVPLFMDGKLPIPFRVSTGFIYSLFGRQAEVNIAWYLGLTLIGSVEIFGINLESEEQARKMRNKDLALQMPNSRAF